MLHLVKSGRCQKWICALPCWECFRDENIHRPLASDVPPAPQPTCNHVRSLPKHAGDGWLEKHLAYYSKHKNENPRKGKQKMKIRNDNVGTDLSASGTVVGQATLRASRTLKACLLALGLT